MAKPNPGTGSTQTAGRTPKPGTGQPSTPPTGANSGIANAPSSGSSGGSGSGSTITTTAAFGNWWDGLWEGIASAAGLPTLGVLGGTGFSWADLGAGLEAAFVAFFKDIFDLIVGPLEIIAGILLWAIALILIFKDDITALAPLAIGALA